MSRLTRDGTAEPISRDKFSGANADREILFFLVQPTPSRIDNLTRLIHALAICVVIHTSWNRFLITVTVYGTYMHLTPHYFGTVRYGSSRVSLKTYTCCSSSCCACACMRHVSAFFMGSMRVSTSYLSFPAFAFLFCFLRCYCFRAL